MSQICRYLFVLVFACVLPPVCTAQVVDGHGTAPSEAGIERLLGLAADAIDAGRQPRAAQMAAQAIDAAERLGRDDLRARGLAIQGRALMLAGEGVQARSALEQARDLARSTQHPDIAASASNDLGTLFVAQRELATAVQHYEASITDATTAADELQVVRATLNRARALEQAGRREDSRTALRDLGARATALPDSAARVALLTSAGQLAASLAGKSGDGSADVELAESLLREATAGAVRAGDARAQSYALGYSSELYESAGQFDDALVLARRAIHQAQLANAPESLYRWQWQIGRLLRLRHELIPATDAYLNAMQTLEGVRRDLAASERGAGSGDGFRRSAGPLYTELVDVLLQRARAANDPQQEQGLLLTARNTMETLKSAELEDYFEDDCVAALKSKTVGIDTVDVHTAAIYPVVLPDRLAILVSFADGIRLYESPVTAATLNAEVGSLRARLEKRSSYQYIPHARQLYDWLLRPIDSDLQAAGVTTLVFAPDGTLRTVPLAALHDGNAFVIDRYAVATVPGLTLTDPRPLASGPSSALLGGLTESVQGFTALPAVAAELDSVSGIYPGTLLKDADFTSASFAAALTESSYSVVHIASHGQFGGDISDTFLLTHDGRIAMNDLESQIGRTATREHPVELLTLSACQTAAGDERAALGLAGVAVKAGARSAVATLWSVSDRASAELVTTFYKELQGGAGSKAAALRTAQLTLLEESRYRHPAYWSPFLLIGNWL